jgi:hypothetical protein
MFCYNPYLYRRSVPLTTYIDLTTAALRAHKPRVPPEHSGLGAVAGGHFGGIRLDLVLATLASHD